MARLSHTRRRLLLRGRVVTRRATLPKRCVIFALCLLGILVSLLPSDALAQDFAQNDSLLVTDVTFTGDPFFPDDQLKLYIRTRRNRRLIGIPGVHWWRWLYNLGDQKLEGGFFGRMFMGIGEPPALFDSVVFATDIEQLRLFYQREGFRSADIVASLASDTTKGEVSVNFQITAGHPTHVRTFKFNGLDVLTASEKSDITSNSLVSSGTVTSDDSLTWKPRNMRYSEPILAEERRRIMTYLRERGFAFVGRDSIHAVVYPVLADSFDVTMDVKLGPRFRFGDLHYEVTGPEPPVSIRTDSLYLASSSSDNAGGAITSRMQGEEKLDFDLLTRTLQFRPGDRYDQSRLIATKRRLDATGVFSFTAIDAQIPDSSDVRLSHVLNLQTRVRHQIRFETFMQERSGALADTENELGAGLGVTYSNVNLFGGGESFRIRSTGSLAADIGGFGGFTSAQWESSASLSYPYLTFPFGRLDRFSRLYDARSQVSLSLLAARRDALKLTLRGRGGARYRFELRHTESLTSIIDLVDITVSNPDTLTGFKDIFLDDVLDAVGDAVQRAQIIEDYTRPQFNNALRYTLRSATSDPFRRDSGHFREVSAEVGGNMGRILDDFVFTPSRVEGSLPGLGVFGGSGSGGRMIYRQYLRFSADIRRYHSLNNRNVFAWKFFTGVAHPTGKSDIVPFDRRFYSGGANSVRAWRLRELGPGSARFTSDSDSLVAETDGSNILGGDIKIEMSAELRTIALRNLFSANWILAVFADAGNVWLGPRNPGSSDGRFRIGDFPGELGVGAGIGLRLGWEYIIVRLDVAYKVHDPRRQGDFMPDQFSKPVLQFGIGHTF